MNRLSLLFAAALAAVVMAAPACPPAAAQQPKGATVIAVLDVQAIMRESSAAKAVQAEVERRRDAFQAEIAKQEKALRAADQDLVSDRASLSQDVFTQRRKDLEKQAAQLRHDVQVRKEQLEGIFNKGFVQIRHASLQIVAGIAQKHGITLVLNKAQVVMAANEMDITAEVMKELNAKLPKVSFAAE